MNEISSDQNSTVLNEHEQDNKGTTQDKLHINDDSLILCKICFTNRIDTIITPCYHASICHECWEKMPAPKTCPICRGYVISTLHVIIDA